MKAALKAVGVFVGGYVVLYALSLQGLGAAVSSGMSPRYALKVFAVMAAAGYVLFWLLLCLWAFRARGRER